LWLIPLGLSLILVLLGGQSYGAIGQNALVFLVHLYALYGLCIVEFFMRQSLTMGWLRAILYLLIIIAAMVIIPVLAFMGLIDSRFDLRKIDAKKVSSS
jgi:isoprenylcysteine carboxyl methyltransferase (ICMT) family protein YpbQ